MNAPASSKETLPYKSPDDTVSTCPQPFDGETVRSLLGIDKTTDETAVEARLADAAIALAESETDAPIALPFDGAKLREIFALPAEASDEEVAAKIKTAGAALKKKETKTKFEETPPPPMHDPKSMGTPADVNARCALGEKLIKEIQAEGKLKDYTSARGEAQRRAPSLFQ